MRSARTTGRARIAVQPRSVDAPEALVHSATAPRSGTSGASTSCWPILNARSSGRRRSLQTQIVERDGLGPGARGSHGTDCLPPLKGAGKRIVGRLSRSIQVPSQSNTGRQDPRALPSITVLKLGHYTPYKSPGPQNHQCPRQILPSCASPALLRAGLVPARESAWSIDRHAVAPLPVRDELPPSDKDYES